MKTKTLISSFIALSLCTLLYAAPKQDNSFKALKTRGVIKEQVQKYTPDDLYRAVWHRDKAEVEEILNSKQVDVNAANGYDQPSLELAISYRDKEIAELLINNGAKIEDYYIQIVVRKGDADMAELLFDNGFVLEPPYTKGYYSYKYLLGEAIYSDFNRCNTKLSEVLIKHGAYKEGALEYAKKRGCKKIVRLLKPSVLKRLGKAIKRTIRNFGDVDLEDIEFAN